MHILMVVIGGLLLLVACYFGATFLGRRASSGAAIFIWLWLGLALVNGAIGVLYAGIPIVNEIAAFIPIFGIPALAARYLARRAG
jgi:hypothetical protein